MSLLALRAVAAAVTVGAGLGLGLRAAPIGGGWLVVLLALSAAAVGLAQQTLP